MVRVVNLGQNPIEAAGLVFRPRRSVEVELKPEQVEAIRANPRLQVVGDELDDGLERLRLPALRALAAERGLEVAARSTKAQLIEAIRASGAGAGGGVGAGGG